MNRRFLSLFVVLASCGGGSESATLAPISPRTAAVNETLVVELTVENGSDALSFDFVAPELPGLRATVSGSGGGGVFRWTPLASHVGTQEFTIQLLRGTTVVDEQPLLITVTPADDAAPVFIRPGAGGSFDLGRDPCVRFDIEIRDDDSTEVTIAARGPLPEGADLFQDNPKSGGFEWCPSADQIAAQERWTIPMLADDRDHPPTEQDYIVVLRTEAKPGCPGDPPVIAFQSPDNEARVTSATGYEVRVSVTDDQGLRDAPLLFYTTSEPDDPANPDVTTFEQLVFAPSSGDWAVRIPSLGLEDGEEQRVFIVVSATDNDDASGATCDNRTDSPLREFVAVRGTGGSGLSDCEPCSESTQCESGLCATAAGGARCVPSCSGSGMCAVGSCGATGTTEGAVLAGCGPVAEVCGGGGDCLDDGREDDDDTASATPYASAITDGQICSGDPDYVRVDVAAGTRVVATLDGFVHAEGDLDLRLEDADGIVDNSASEEDREEVEHCFSDAGASFVQVLGYEGAQNGYRLNVAATPDPVMCCADDASEENDTASAATALTFASGTADFEGTVCPADDDYFRVPVDGPSTIDVLLFIEDFESADLDLELRDPEDRVVGSSRDIGEEESISLRVSDPGNYAIRVFGVGSDTSAYLGSVEVTPDASCTSSRDCPIGEVCNAGACEARVCSGSTCPADHICPDAGIDPTPSECGETCTINASCRSAEACKWFWEGRYCGRRGSGTNGDACTTFADCGGQRACAPWPGGYCARQGCESSSDCESGTHCIDSGLGFNLCALACEESADVCRLSEGYRCAVEATIDRGDRSVCVGDM
ncbi:MAG: PPC domain-containing protein [Myxococcota bacterium]